MVDERRFVGYLLLDWRSGKMRLMSRKPKSVPPYAIPVKVDIKVTAPTQAEVVAKGELELTHSKLKEFLIEGL